MNKSVPLLQPQMPKVSIGMPVYNGAATLVPVIESLLKQTFTDFELIISDNASTDETEVICKKYAAQDSRIRYIRQSENIGGGLNFKFVLDRARAQYFMWSACDDTRSPEFLEENILFLETNPDYVASTCPNCLEGRTPTGANLVTFSMEGNVAQRFSVFLDNSWVSHGIFYSVIRTKVLWECEVVGLAFFGIDWAVDLFLASRGKIHRTKKGLMVSGVTGASSQANAWRKFRAHSMEGWVLPFYEVSWYALKLSSQFTFPQRVGLIKQLAKLNATAAYNQLKTEIYPFYSSKIRPWLRMATKPRFDV